MPTTHGSFFDVVSEKEHVVSRRTVAMVAIIVVVIASAGEDRAGGDLEKRCSNTEKGSIVLYSKSDT